MTTRITKELTWAMAHRLVRGYEGPCRNLHGHSYRCEVELEADELDKFGMVADFGLVKKVLGGWLDTWMDHAVLAVVNDQELVEAVGELDGKIAVMPKQYSNTTAEQIADMLFVKFRSLIESSSEFVRLISVTVWETETSKATRSVDYGA